MTTQAITSTKWALDSAHSEVHFKVKHLMISTVTGTLGQFEGSVESFDDDFNDAKVHFSADINTLSTGDANRDGHLNSADFFDATNHPKMTFESTGFTKKSEGSYLMTGLLSIRGISKEVSLNVEFGGLAKDPWGNVKAGFTLDGKIHRSEWGLNWNAALETGGVLLSDEVRILAEVQLTKI